MPDFQTSITKHLRQEEGEVLHSYLDHLGFVTIGVGRLIDERKGGGITPVESAYLLDNDIEAKTKALDKAIPWCNQLAPARKGVLLSMAFQMGVDGLLGFKNTLKLVQQGDYTNAAIAMLRSEWAMQTTGRAKRMADQMRTGEWVFKE